MSVQINSKPILEFAESAKTSHQNHLESLINHAIQHTNIFQFTELLQVQSIKDLANVEQYKKLYGLLCLFAYQNYRTYILNTDKFPPLNDLQIKKLRMLTLVDLAQSEKVLGFELLKYELGLQNQDALEDLIIETIYVGAISGKISQSDRVFRVSGVISRDVRAQDLSNIKSKLQKILAENNRVSSSLQQKINELNNERAADQNTKKRQAENRLLAEQLRKPKEHK